MLTRNNMYNAYLRLSDGYHNHSTLHETVFSHLVTFNKLNGTFKQRVT